jgi:hypothetical protein
MLGFKAWTLVAGLGLSVVLVSGCNPEEPAKGPAPAMPPAAVKPAPKPADTKPSPPAPVTPPKKEG